MSYLVMHINLLTLFNPNELHKYKTFIFYLLINIKMHWQKHITLFFPFFFFPELKLLHTLFFFFNAYLFYKEVIHLYCYKIKKIHQDATGVG